MSTRRTALRSALFLALALSLSWAAGVAASSPASTPAERTPAAVSDLSDAAELEAFLDDLIATAMAEHDIPGATVSVVKDGSLLFAEGYGFANLEESQPVVASETLFRIGSVTKLFTWTAVMQLVEQGELDLDADVNTYLDAFEIPATYPQPITMAHLMTHTAGFEERQLGISVVDHDLYRPLVTFLETDMPERIYAPGSVTAYSNYGTALAGYIVERVSGESIDGYIGRHILAPLDMRHSSLEQVLPIELAENLATSYEKFTGEFEALPQEYFEIQPASGMSATAADMANFMIAHLHDGQFNDTQILEPATAQDMHRQHFTNDPRLSGIAYGFVEQQLSNQRLLVHAGSTNFEQFQSYLVLMPDHGVGLFVSFNAEGGGPAKFELVQAFLDRYYPQAAAPDAQGMEGFAQRAPRFVGSYQATRTTESNIEKFVGLLPSAVEVTANADGTLSIAGGPMGAEARRWVEVEPLLFRQVDGWDEVAFAEDGDGKVTSMFVGSLPIVGYTMQDWWETSPPHLLLLAAIVFIFVTAIVALPIAWLVGRRRRTPGTRPAGRARGLAWLVSMLFVTFLIVFIVGMADLEAGIGPAARAALGLGVVASVVTGGLAVAMTMAWKNGYGGRIGRVYLSAVTLSAAAFVWFLNYWNLLGFRL